VRFLLDDERVPRTDTLIEIAKSVRSANIGRADEYFTAVAKVIHLAREMVALERADAAEAVAQHTVAAREPVLIAAKPAQRAA
jgi:hypothetical protein